jgi:hypothetical protein
MPIVTDAVYAGRYPKGLGDYRPDNLSDEHWRLVKTISKNQRKGYRKADIIPRQVLCLWWDLGYLPHKRRPNQGADLMRLLDHLDHWAYLDEAHAEKGVWLFDRIVIEELMPRRIPWPVKSSKCRGKKRSQGLSCDAYRERSFDTTTDP